MSDEADCQVLHRGRFLQFTLRNGWECIERHGCTGVVVIVPVTAAGELVLVTQFRPPVNAEVIEVPAGLVNDDEAASLELDIEAARRELLEETGVDSPNWRVLGRAVASPGVCGEVVSFFAAEDGEKVAEGGGVAGETIQTHFVPLDSVDEWLLEQERSGAVIAAIVHSGLHLYRARNHHPELV
jgi:ADP-ribose pyrophosphatase